MPRIVPSAIFSRSTSAMNARATRMKRLIVVSSKRSVTNSRLGASQLNLVEDDDAVVLDSGEPVDRVGQQDIGATAAENHPHRDARLVVSSR